jgi:DNA-binding CsgD family transcriptional regulator
MINDVEKIQAQKLFTVTLTQREIDCLTQALQGKSPSQIAETLRLSINSVRFYLSNIGIKLAVQTG